ncbi:MAG: exodeoxyribonuclease V subunit gamma [Ilumatobacteraceae bacterium]
MGLHLHVDTGLEPLAERLAARLADVPTDPFATEVVVVPGDGVRSWLTHALARHLGICSNIDFVYPARLVHDVLGPNSDLGRWGVGPLTWVIHSLLTDDGRADALRARTIADLFDRYTLYRPHMVRAWSDGNDVNGVGAPLAAHQRWQPELWRRVQERLGGPSDAERMRTLVDALATGGVPDGVSLPGRVSVFGITSMPHPHIEVLAALSHHADIAVYAPIASPARWAALADGLTAPLLHPMARDTAPLTTAAHRLNRAWARTGEEGHVLLLDAVREVGGTVHPPTATAPVDGARRTLLQHLQHGITTDDAPKAGVAIDGTVVWHRTFGPARQVEVLRDHLLHILAETDENGAPLVEPRHIAILTPDVERFAPLIDSVFAGDPDNGLPAIPVQVADRSLGAENPVATAALAFLDLLDGRFRVGDVAAFAGLPVVAARFGLDAAGAERLGELLDDANARWGLDADDQAAAGIAPLGAFTLADARDRAAGGAATAIGGSALAVGGVAPATEVLFDDLAVIGAGSALLQALRAAHDTLTRSLPAWEWAGHLLDVLRSLVTVDDDRAFLWRSVERRVNDIIEAVDLAGPEAERTPVDPAEMVGLLAGGLASSAGRPRFDTGRVTLSSLTALRGVPHRVICLLGMDLDVEPSGFGSPDDLVAAAACLGDRDARSEHRAQILDTVLAAGERLIVCSTGFDVRTRAEVPPSVALSELVDTVRDLTGGPFTAVEHPRQAWSEAAFAPRPTITSAPWSHDAGAVEAALARRGQGSQRAPIPVLDPAGSESVIHISDLARSLTEPVRAFCQDRLGLILREHTTRALDSRIPLGIGGLEAYEVRRRLLGSALAGDTTGDWSEHLAAAGDIPPLGYGTRVVDTATAEVQAVLDLLAADGYGTPLTVSTIAVAIPAVDDGPGIDGEITGVVHAGDTAVIVDARASTYSAAHLLERIIDLVLAQVTHPDTQWSAVLYRRRTSSSKRGRVTVALRDPGDAVDLLELLFAQRRRSLTTPVPFFPALAEQLAVGRTAAAASAWTGSDDRPGERVEPWNRLFFDMTFDELARSHDLAGPVDELWTTILDRVVLGGDLGGGPDDGSGEGGAE